MGDHVTLPRLSAQTLGQVQNATLPGYDRAGVTPGILHLGLGNFHRAHQAVYVDDTLAADPGWGIIGVSLRRPDMPRALAPQDGLYTLVEQAGSIRRGRIIGSVLQAVAGAQDPAAVLRWIADPAIRIITLTVTEKGYLRDPATGDLMKDDPNVRADLARPDTPRTVPGLLAAGLAARRVAGVAPPTVLSCDNLPMNGAALARVVGQFAAMRDPALARWITGAVEFPATMVDRIVPATTDQDRAGTAALTGLDDAWPVMAEPFAQWVIEDRFTAGRPDLVRAGAEMVADVAPYEEMKLRLLNGAHSAIAYFGQLLGYATVAEAFGAPRLRAFVQAMWADEIAPHVPLSAAAAEHYTRALAARFDNPTLRHQTAQIAMDGSQKVPQRLLATIRDCRGAGRAHPRLTAAVAAWMAYASGGAGRFAVVDPMAGRFADLAVQAVTPRDYARAMLAVGDVFGTLGQEAGFAKEIADAYERLAAEGPEVLIRA
ncbi:MAG: mannitol dehydrogenase family protein [Rhodobacteraceae bacterium]|nr:mannitol dehydrogenase family protein [Paracoccaceae bacterium]